MDFKQELVKKMLDKGLSNSSIKNYIRNLEILNDDKPLKNLNFLKNKNEIMDILSKKKPNTQRSYLIAIASALSIIDDSKMKSTQEYYYDLMMNMNKELKEQESKNEKTDKQSENWISKEEIDKKMNELIEEVKKYKTNDISNRQYNKVLQMIVLALYTKQAPRRNADYQYCIVIDKKQNVPEDKINYLVYNDQEFWFRKYKTSKSELKDDKKELIVPINNELMDIIKLYFKFHPLIQGKKIKYNEEEEIPFLCDIEGEPLLNVNSITYILNKVFNKNIGSSMMRHFYTSNKYGTLLDEMKEDAKNMSHSLSQQKDYIKN